MSVLDLLKFKREKIAQKSINEVVEENKDFFDFMSFSKSSGLTEIALNEIKRANSFNDKLMPIEFKPKFKFLGFTVRIILSAE